MKAAKYIKLEVSDQNGSRQTIKHTSDGERYLEVVEKCSHNIPFQNRELGNNIIKLSGSGEIDTLIIDSINCLGKDGQDIFKTIKTLMDLNVKIIAKKEELETISENGEENKLMKTVINIMSSIYEHEKDIKMQKQIQGINIAKLKGTYKYNGGNKPKLSYKEFISKMKNANCLKYLKKGESIRKAAKSSGLSLGTAVKIKKLAELNGDLK